MYTKNVKLAAVTMTLTLGLAACEKQPTVEFTGADIEQAMEAAQKTINTATQTLNAEVANIGRTLDDASITTKVRGELLADPSLNGLEIHVETIDGVVTLRGTVNSQENSKKARQIAAAAPDVKWVDNRLDIKPAS